MLRELDVSLADGRTLHAYDTDADGDGDRLPVLWHAGTPNVGSPPEPLFATADRLGIRWVGYDRPGYGGSTARPDRDVASAAADAAAVADALGLDRFAVFGHSGGGPHALACVALLADRVPAALIGSSPAPYEADGHGLDWFAGLGPTAEASFRAAIAGRAAKEAFEAAADGEPDFTEADWEALSGAWGWFGSVVGPALANGPGALIDDDLAFVSPWGFDPAATTRPVLFLHGADDRVVPPGHSAWLAGQIVGAELRLVPGEGHVSVLRHADEALAWLVAQATA